MLLTTKIDEMVKLLQKKGRTNFHQIAKKLSWNENSVEKIALILEKEGLAETFYPINMMRSPWATIKKLPEKEEKAMDGGKVVEKYEVADKGGSVTGIVKVMMPKTEKRPVYNVSLPRVSPCTRAYMEHAKREVSKKLSLELAEKGLEDTLENFQKRSAVVSKIIKRDLEPSSSSLDALTGMIINEMYGLKELEALIGDRRLEEVVINTANLPVSVYHRKWGWLKSNLRMGSEIDTENYAAQIARKVGRQISLLTPILDARLSTGDRANATLYPISAHGNTITLRLFSKNPWTIITFLKKEYNTMSYDMAALLWQAMQYEMNVVIAGGTASGKTSALNGLLALLQPFQRVVTIEDTRELALPKYQWNWVPLVTRPPNPEGMGEVTMLDLLVNSLRMRPDRIVMGEIRRKREAEVLFEAMHTGHSVYSTLHADTSQQVIKRLTEPPIEVPAAELDSIHLLLVQYRDRRKNIRRTLELTEIVPGPRGPELNHVYMWKPRKDTFEMVKPAHRYTEQMNLHTGMTQREVEEDQGNKIVMLKWMMKHNIENIDDVGKVMKTYYSDEATVLKAAKKGTAPSKVL